MSRSSWKIPYICPLFLSNLATRKKNFPVWQRASVIPATFANRKFKVHNGVWILSLEVKTGMVGHKFGEFAFTKRMGKEIHFKKKKKKKKKN